MLISSPAPSSYDNLMEKWNVNAENTVKKKGANISGPQS